MVCGTQALVMCPGLTVLVLACGILVPPPEIKPMSSALAGGCLTTGPPGKSQKRLDFCQMFFLHLMKWMCMGVWVSFIYWFIDFYLLMYYIGFNLNKTCWKKLPFPLIFPLSSFSLSAPWLDDTVLDHPAAHQKPSVVLDCSLSPTQYVKSVDSVFGLLTFPSSLLTSLLEVHLPPWCQEWFCFSQRGS